MAVKKYKDSVSAMRYHAENFERATGESLVTALSVQFLEDCNPNYVPILTGRLRRSAEQISRFSDGLIIWQTPYARRKFFEGSVTGVAYWTVVNMQVNKVKYRTMIVEELKRRT